MRLSSSGLLMTMHGHVSEVTMTEINEADKDQIERYVSWQKFCGGMTGDVLKRLHERVKEFDLDGRTCGERERGNEVWNLVNLGTIPERLMNNPIMRK